MAVSESPSRFPAYAALLVCVLTSLTVLVPADLARADTGTLTGTVSAGATGGRSTTFRFTTTEAGPITGSLRWAGTADLDLRLQRREPDRTWTTQDRSTTSNPEEVGLQWGAVGTYRFLVTARSGAAAFSLPYEFRAGTLAMTFLTVLFSRSEITTANDCVRDDTGVARLDTVVAPELQRRGMRPTGSVQTGDTEENSLLCVYYGRSMAASWADLARLRDRYGWRFVSHSRHFENNIPALDRDRQWDETCGSQLDLRAHGHRAGDGLFLWPSGPTDEAVQSEVVSSCFAFGRKYRPAANTRASVTTPPYWANVEGISGGACNNPDLACHRMAVDIRYESPAAWADVMRSLRPGDWRIVQSYVLVTGFRPGVWDCRSPDWRAHWTKYAERYCYSDYLSILDAIPASVTVTDPKTVARAWGRTGYTVPTAAPTAAQPTRMRASELAALSKLRPRTALTTRP